MKCFRYNLNSLNQGPAGKLPNHSITGIYVDDSYYGAALIDDLSVIEDWNPVEVTPLEFNQICTPGPSEETPEPLPALVQLEGAVREKYASLMEQVILPYLPQERETWFIQVEESLKYKANASIEASEIPLITALSQQRNESLDVITSIIIQKNTEYRTAVGTILGQQQKLIETIYKTT